MIKDLDSNLPEPSKIPDEDLPDDQLFKDGKIKVLFNRVKLRKKGKWDPTLRARIFTNKEVVEIGNEESLYDDLAKLDEDCLAKYTSGDVECFIVRYGDKKFAYEVFKNGISVGAYSRKTGEALIKGLFEEFPRNGNGYEEPEDKAYGEPVLAVPPVIKKRGRPKKEVKEVTV